MRAIASLCLLLAATLAVAGCFNPGDLGPEPFKCNVSFPDCPDKYICGTDSSVNVVGKIKDCPTKNSCVCVFPCGMLNDCPNTPLYMACTAGVCQAM